MFLAPCPDRILDWGSGLSRLTEWITWLLVGERTLQYLSGRRMTHTYERAFYGLQRCFSSLLLGIARHTKLIKMACFPELNLL